MAHAPTNHFKVNNSIRVLVLDGNTLQLKGGIQIAAMLQVNTSLTRLGIACTELSTDGVIAMATVLRGNSTLLAVDLSRPLLHSQLEETTIHISRMLEVCLSFSCSIQLSSVPFYSSLTSSACLSV